MTIEKLLLNDTVTDSTVFAGNESGQDYKYQAQSLVDYFNSKITETDTFQTQLAIPVNLGSTTIGAAGVSSWLIMNPAGTIATYAVTFPTVLTLVDNQEILITTTQEITSFSLFAPGASTVYGAPTTLAANAFFKMKYNQSTNCWYRVG
jgi:hypothetical protein